MDTDTNTRCQPPAAYTYDVEDGVLGQYPVWEPHRRGTNWLAIIAPNPSAPSGLDRTFLPKARGHYYYLVADLTVGSPVEFGADYTSGNGNRSRRRWYGVIREIADDHVTIEQYDTARAAIRAARDSAPAVPHA